MIGVGVGDNVMGVFVENERVRTFEGVFAPDRGSDEVVEMGVDTGEEQLICLLLEFPGAGIHDDFVPVSILKRSMPYLLRELRSSTKKPKPS